MKLGSTFLSDRKNVAEMKNYCSSNYFSTYLTPSEITGLMPFFEKIRSNPNEYEEIKKINTLFENFKSEHTIGNYELPTDEKIPSLEKWYTIGCDNETISLFANKVVNLEKVKEESEAKSTFDEIIGSKRKADVSSNPFL